MELIDCPRFGQFCQSGQFYDKIFFTMADWLSWLERFVHIEKVGGSNPSSATCIKIVD